MYEDNQNFIERQFSSGMYKIEEKAIQFKKNSNDLTVRGRLIAALEDQFLLAGKILNKIYEDTSPTSDGIFQRAANDGIINNPDIWKNMLSEYTYVYNGDTELEPAEQQKAIEKCNRICDEYLPELSVLKANLSGASHT